MIRVISHYISIFQSIIKEPTRKYYHTHWIDQIRTATYRNGMGCILCDWRVPSRCVLWEYRK